MDSKFTQPERASARATVLSGQLKAAEQKILRQDRRLSDYREEVDKLQQRIAGLLAQKREQEPAGGGE